MKVLFEDENRNTALMIGLDSGNEIEVTSLDNDGGLEYRVLSRANLDLQQAYKLQSFLGSCIREIEEEHRKKLPLWKRLF